MQKQKQECKMRTQHNYMVQPIWPTSTGRSNSTMKQRTPLVLPPLVQEELSPRTQVSHSVISLFPYVPSVSSCMFLTTISVPLTMIIVSYPYTEIPWPLFIGSKSLRLNNINLTEYTQQSDVYQINETNCSIWLSVRLSSVWSQQTILIRPNVH